MKAVDEENQKFISILSSRMGSIESDCCSRFSCSHSCFESSLLLPNSDERVKEKNQRSSILFPQMNHELNRAVIKHIGNYSWSRDILCDGPCEVDPRQWASTHWSWRSFLFNRGEASLCTLVYANILPDVLSGVCYPTVLSFSYHVCLNNRGYLLLCYAR